MTMLSALLVERKIATEGEVQDALARQLLRGGDLATALLELGVVSEQALLPVLAEEHGLAPGPSGELPPAPPRLLDLVSGALAARHDFYPLEERDGCIRIAVGQPLPPPLEENLTFWLGLALEQLVVPVARIKQAIARDYGIPAERRMQRLAAKLDGRADPSPSTFPSASGPSQPGASQASARQGRPTPAAELLPPLPEPSPAADVSAAPADVSSSAAVSMAGAEPARSQPLEPEPWPGADAGAEIAAFASTPAPPGMVLASSLEPVDDFGEPPEHDPGAESSPPPTIHAPRSALERMERQIAASSFELPARTATLRGVASAGPAADDEWAAERPVGLVTPLVGGYGGIEPVSLPAPASVPAGAPFEADEAAIDSGWDPAPLFGGEPSVDSSSTLDTLPEASSVSPPQDFVLEAASATAAQVERKRRLRSGLASSRALAGWARRTLGQRTGTTRPPPAVRHRGPLTPATAESALESVRTPLSALGVLFDFARQYFEYSALFLVHGDLAEGADAFGPGTSRERIAGIGVPLDLPSVFRIARDRGTPTVEPLGSDGIDRVLAEDLGRTHGRAALVLPVVVGRRTVALLYGDHGEEPVQLSSVGDVLAFAPLVSVTIERLILRRKAARGSSAARLLRGARTLDASEMLESEPAPPSDDARVSESAPTERTMPAAHEYEAQPDPDPTPDPEKTEAAHDAAASGASAASATMPDSSPTLELAEVIVAEEADGATLQEVLALESAAREPEPERDAATTVFSLSPKAPPAAYSPGPVLPPVLIQADLVERVIAGGPDAEQALGEILELGEAAIPAVFSRFPGPIQADPSQIETGRVLAASAGPVLKIVAAMRRLALPFLAVRSADGDPNVRFWSCCLLGELHYRDAAVALVPRLFDESRPVRRVSVRGLRSIVDDPETAATVREELLRILHGPEQTEDRRLLALHFIRDFRFQAAIPRIVRLLEDASPAVAIAVYDVLRAFSGEDLGRDPTRWLAWWEGKGRAMNGVSAPAKQSRPDRE